MPSLAEFAAVQPSFQTFPCSLSTQIPSYVKGSLGIFSFGNEKGLSLAWKTLNRPKRVDFNVRRLNNRRRYFLIGAVATLESKCLVHHANGHICYKDSKNELPNYAELEVGFELSSLDSQTESSNDEIDEVNEREQLRRMRISKANKGNTPWNKGRKHSAETLQRIKERTKLAMQNPKVKMKLTKIGHAQSDDTRVKIGAGVRIGWQRRREMLTVQELCLHEWENLVAEASRQGYNGEEELQWNSYSIKKEELKEEWVDSIEQRKRSPRQSRNRRAPKSAEQRKKISEAIAAKWADSVYRQRVCSALHTYHGTPAGAKRRPRKKPSENTQSTTRSPHKRKVVSYIENSSVNGVKLESHRLKASKAPKYKDPLVGSKLEMIKNIRAQRTTVETQKSEAIGRARLLIAEAEKAAKALEVAATTSPIARASLMETRKLIAEAKQSVESIEMGPMRTSSPIDNSSFAAPNEQVSLIEKEPTVETVDQNEADHRQVNGIQSLDFDLTKFNFLDTQTYEGGFLGDSTSTVSYEGHRAINGVKIQNFGEKTKSRSVCGTKKWVRGKLIEAADSE